MNETIEPTNPGLWKDKAVAAAVKAEKMLWGKNNETIQAFMYEAGFSLATMHDALLGWQIRNTLRPAESWGIEGIDKIRIPEGITIPVIREKELKRLVVYRLGHSHDGHYHTVEGSAPVPLVLEGSTKRTALVTRELDALLLHQELKKEWTVVATGTLPPSAIEAPLAQAEELHLIALRKDEERLAPWQASAKATHTLDTDSLVTLARAGTLADTLKKLFG
jgi:hypothetical protein